MKNIKDVHKRLSECRACPEMCGTPVHGLDNHAQIMLIGQAPGPHEADLGRPFAYTAGKTLFKWLNEVSGLDEEDLREKIYFAAVARCFPGKNVKGGGDRVPSAVEIEACRKFLEAEVKILKPKLIIPVGKLAIQEVLGIKNFALENVIGKRFFQDYHGHSAVIIPLPHPSGISMWYKKEPGRSLLKKALTLIKTQGL